MRPTIRSACQALVVGIMLGVPSGCEPGTESRALVRGRVSYKGVLVRTGTIVFTPDTLRGTSGPLARSEIQADGSYALQTEGKAGAIVGWHRVTVMAVETNPVNSPSGDVNMPRSLLPDKYRDPELSGLSCEIRSGQENCLDFDLD